MSNEKPTRAEIAEGLVHDPRQCAHCCSERYGDQAPSDDEREIDRLRAELRLLKAQSDEEFARQALEGWTEDPCDPLSAIGRMYQGVCAERDSLRAALAEARSGAFIADYSAAVPNLLAEATQTERARCIENVRDSDACDSCRRSIEADIVGSGGALDARGSK